MYMYDNIVTMIFAGFVEDDAMFIEVSVDNSYESLTRYKSSVQEMR